MKNFCRLAPRVFVFSALAATGVQAQPLRCDLVQSTTQCFDLDTLRGQTITVPSNVTRLENQGLNLCQRNVQQGGNTDIVYVYDNSGSMRVDFAWVGRLPGDTLTDTVFYYFSPSGGTNPTNGFGSTTCNMLFDGPDGDVVADDADTVGGGALGFVNIQQWNAFGTATSAVGIRRLNPNKIPNSGCTNYSGDPYYVRGRAYRLGIQEQANLASASMAGIMSFTDPGIANFRRPVTLNAAGLSALLGPPGNGVINAVSSGGTNYTTPLDSSRIWLRTAPITPQTPGRTKAIIFLSDGRPSNTNYLPLNPATPPVYGIFLGRDTVNTGRMVELATLSGGRFFLVPPHRPDSLISVVRQILNIILVQYNPATFSMTNLTIPQSSTASLNLDTSTNPDVWRVRLDSVIGLRGPSLANSMRFITSYSVIQNGVPTGTQTDTINFTLSTSGTAANGTQNIAGTTFATRCYAPSRIQWLCHQTSGTNCASPGIRPLYFTEADSLAVRLRLRSSASDSDDAAFAANNSTNRATQDAENQSLPRAGISIDSALFILNPLPMRVSAATGPGANTPTLGNNVLQPFYSDFMVARWLHPRDVRDSARDTIPVQPAQVVASTWFAVDSNGVPVTAPYPFTTPANGIWVVVQDNRAMPGVIYRDTIWTDAGDRLVLTLTPVPGLPGRFTAMVPFVINATVDAFDAVLQISPLGEQLHTAYRDPLYSDYATNNASFRVSVQEPPTLRFVTATGTVLADSQVVPFGARVYLRYTDDNVSGGPATKAVQIAANSLRLGASIVRDTLTGVLRDSGLASGSTTLRAWRDSFLVAETLIPNSGNATLEGAYRMQMTASVTAHNNVGSSAGQPISVRMIIFARPDSTPVITFAESVNLTKVNTLGANNLGGPVDILLTLRDQDFVSNAQDTVLVTALCPASGDSVAGLRLVQTSPPGTYANGDTVLRIDPNGNVADRLLGCPAGSPLTIRYVDAVYGTLTSLIVNETAAPTYAPSNPWPQPYYFFSQVNVVIASATSGAAIDFTRNGSMPRPGLDSAYTAPIGLIAPDTLRAVAMGPAVSHVRSRIANSAYLFDPNRPASRITILDAAGNAVPVSPLTGRRTLTDLATSLRLDVSTPQGGLGGSVTTVLGSRLGDVENPPLSFIQFTGQTNIFQNNLALRGAAVILAANGNDTLETRLPDTLIATWRNPINAADVVFDTVLIWPSYQPSTACFAASAGGPCVAAPFPNSSGPTTTTVFVRVTARADLPGAYSARVSTGPGGGADVETFALTQTAPGSGIYFSAAITMNENTPKTSANATLQAYELGDTLRALFVHPIYRDSANGSALYGPPTEQAAALTFLDPTGTPLLDNSTYLFNGAANDSVRVRYTDDWSSAIASLVNSKTLILVLDVFRNGVRVARDTESVTLTYNVGAGVWLGTYPLRERMPTGLNLTVESAFRGVLTASVQSHTNLGGTTGQPVLNQRLNIVAAPNGTAALTFTEHVNTASPEGPVDIAFILTDQDFLTNQLDTAYVTATCPLSGDSVVLRLRETATTSGIYSSAGSDTLFRDGAATPNFTNRILSCPDGGDIALRYTDPVYGGVLQSTITETAMPTATPPSGTTFFSQQSVTLTTTTAGAPINYTNNNTLPQPGQPINYTVPISLIASDTLKAVAMGPGGNAAGYVRSRVLTASYIRTPLPSRIAILDSVGNVIPVNPAVGRRTVTDGNTSLRIRVTTSQGGLTSPIASAIRSQGLGDDEAPALPFNTFNGQSNIYLANIALSGIAGATIPNDGNGTLQSRLPDTLIATWTNPIDPADVVRDTVIILPSFVQSTVCFTATSGGACQNQFANGTTTVYVRVDARANLPGSYTARVTTGPTANGVDSETVVLSQSSPGVYVSAAITMNENAKVVGNNTLQVFSVGDQLQSVFIHPQYGDTSIGVAGYGQPPEIPATLVFLSPTGTVYAPNFLYTLVGGDSVRIRYRDDWSSGIDPLVNSKQLRLVLDVMRNGVRVGGDTETVTLTYSAGPTAWLGTYALRESLSPVNENDIVETRLRGVLTATVTTHNNAGTAGPDINQTLIIARPDAPTTLTFVDSVNAGAPEGPVDIRLTLQDQDYVVGFPDTAYMFVGCTTDSIPNLLLVQTAPGVYAAGEILVRNLALVNTSDRLLSSCPDGGTLSLRYVDPVYGTISQWTITETAMPTANPPGGTTFSVQLTVSLATATSGANISYTQNGNLPRPGQPTAYTVPINLIASDTLKVVAMGTGGNGAGFVRSRVMTASYAWTPLASRLEILDAGGNSVSTVNDLATSLQVRVTTSQGGLTSPTPAAMHSQILGDDETGSLTFIQYNGQANVYQGSVALLGGATVANDANGTLQTRLPDTVIATWTNPANANDVVRDTVIVLPAPFLTAVCFSATSGGACVSQLPNGTDTVYVRVASRPGLPGTYVVNISSGPAGGSDSLGPLALTELVPGSGIYYSGPIVLNENTPKNSTNGTLQVYSVGDVLTATFVHPQYQTTTTGTVTYAAPGPTAFTLVFLDSAGNVLQLPITGNNPYSLANDSIYVRYTDDWSTGIDSLVRNKTLTLTLDILHSLVRIGGDTESVTLVYNPAQNAWLGAYALRDRLPRSGNDSVESQFRGQLTATVQTHSIAGLTPGQPAISETMLIAYPDQPATLALIDASGGPVGRLTTSVSITLVDQVFTTVPGAQVTVRVTCQGTGDFVNILLTGNGTGTYTGTLPKDEGAGTIGDNRLACQSSDNMTATYTDPVYGTGITPVTVSWNTPPTVVLYYALTTDPGRSRILQVSDNTDSNFLAVVVTPSPSLTLRDSVQVRLRSTQGETEIFWARETGIATDTFLVSIPFQFSLSSPVSGNNRFDPQLNSGAPSTSVNVTGTAILVSGDTAVPSAITLNSQFNPARPGYVRDRNGDGIVETVYLPFSRPVTRMPAGIDTIYWNSDGANRRVGSQFSLSADSLTLIVTLNGSGLGAPFPQFITGAATPTPVAVLPPTPYFGGVRVDLNDSAGPVPQTAGKRPSNAAAEPDPTNPQILRLKPDTLVITVSEPIMTTSNWYNVFTFTKTSNCQDTTAVRFAITTVSEPVPDPTTGNPSTGYTRFTLYANYGLVSGQNQNCIFLQTNRIVGGPGPFSDVRTNAPGRLGIPLGGSDAPPQIPYAGGYPPLWLPGNPIGNGMTSGNPIINFQNGIIVYLPPVCPVTRVDCRDSASGRTQPLVQLPDSISAVKVITSSAYIAHIRLYDHLGNFVQAWVQDFGNSGELENPNRVDPSGQGYRSFLVWNKRDEKGQKAGTGVYIWKVNFEFTGKRELRFIRTGLVRTGL